MKAGRELDALVVEKVWPDCTVGMAAIGENDEDVLAVWKLDGERDWIPLPCYSTETAAAWQVVGKLHSEGWQFDLELYEGEQPMVCFFRKRDSYGSVDPHVAQADTAPLAICLAALKAVGVPT